MTPPERLYSTLLLVLLVLSNGISYAGVFESRQFDTREQADRYRNLTAELRCLVCQNQNIADSNADLAKDLRDKVYTMIMAGQSDTDIVDFMVSRYGDFVLYRPPLRASTLLLWLAPFAVVLISLGLLVRYIRARRRTQDTRPVLSDEQRRLAARLLAAETTED